MRKRKKLARLAKTWGTCRDYACERADITRWMVALMIVGLLALAAFLVFTQRRSAGAAEIGVLPPIEESLASIAGLTSSTVTRGNTAQVIENGAFFDAIEAGIDAARHHVHLETFVWWKGATPDRVAAALARAAARGVEVRVLIDAMGGQSADPDTLDKMRAVGASVWKYRPLGLAHAHAQNYRDHRKVLVVDARVAYCMGHGIADEWSGDGQDADHWRDTAARIQGPAVNALQSVFADNWVETTSEVFVGTEYFPEQPQPGDVAIHVAASSSGDAVSNVEMTYLLAIASAREEIRIGNPYFAPDSDVINLLVEARKRGVEVLIMAPGPHTDSRSVKHAGHRHYRRLLESGVRLFENQETMTHQKVMVIDRKWSHVGSTNLDVRSLEMSEEVSVGFLSPDVAASLVAAHDRDIASSKEITLDEWKDTSPWHRMFDWSAYFFNEQL